MERGGEMQDSSHYNGRACLDLPNGNAVIKLDSWHTQSIDVCGQPYQQLKLCFYLLKNLQHDWSLTLIHLPEMFQPE